MKVEWFVDCKNPDEKEERREIVQSGRPLRELLQMILEKRLQRVQEDRKKRSLYDSPNWAFIQADLVGAERELTELLSLMTIEGTE